MAAVHDWLWTGWSPSIFSSFGTIWLFSFPQHEKTLSWESAIEDFFEDQDESFYTTGIQALQHRWEKCVDRRGDYVKKINHILSNSTIAS